MAYQFYEGMIEQNEDTLHSVATALAEGRPLLVRYPTFREASTAVPKMHNLLKATEVLVDECGGRYRHLRKACKVSLHMEAGIPGVVFSARTPGLSTVATSPHVGALSEKDVAKHLQAEKPARYEAVFLPTPDYKQHPQGWYITVLDLCGYYMEEEEPIETEDGMIKLTCLKYEG